MRSVCGLSARSKRIMALKYNPSSLPLTASNLKESNVGKIICQGSIESSRRGTCPFFSVFLHHNENKLSHDMCFFHFFHSFKCDNNASDTFRRKAGFLSLILERLCTWHICGPVKDNLIASSCFSCFEGWFWFVTTLVLFLKLWPSFLSVIINLYAPSELLKICNMATLLKRSQMMAKTRAFR